MTREIDFTKYQWIRGSDSPDPNGPLDVPFTPYDRDWSDRPLIEVIGETARRLPAQIAIDDGAVRLTYSQLFAMACRLSHAINRTELPPGPIGIKLSYDALHPVAILGCLAAGRPCLLMSQDNPPDYNQRLITASGLQGLLINEEDARNGSVQGGPRLIPIEPALMTGEDFDERPAGRLGPDDPAFIVSTSGSTGVPKLIARSQRRLHLGVSSNVHSGHFNENDRFLNLGSPANGAAVSRNTLPLLIGGRLHIVDIPRAGMGGILRVLRDQKITVLRATVSIMKALSQLDDAHTHLASLRAVWVGGEMLLQKDLSQIRAVLPPSCRLGYSLNMTEVGVARWFVPETDDHDPIRVAVGYLNTEAEVLLLDDEGRSCAPGEIGELIVRSRRVALGEWRDGHVMPDRFQRDPTDPTKRIYRTGDLARICPDGVMVVHGRKDRMIKIRGQRVEPAVVETAIRDVAGVADAVVAAQQADGEVRIYSFIVPRGDAGDSLLTVVHESLKTALPSYMRPSEILIVKSLPRNAAGKVDIQSLLALIPSDDTAAASAATGPAPSVSRDPVSGRARDMVADAWRAAFRAGQRDSTLSFEAAGGDSLQFMQIIFRLEQLSGRSLSLDSFDVSMTQVDMARRLDFLLGGGIEPQRKGKQIFLFPGLGGDEPRLLQFRAGCAPELSFVTLDYGEWTEWVEPGFDFDSIVNRMIVRIQEVSPTGPLRLAGYSLGGGVSLVVASRLHAAGREIENLLILDSKSLMSPQDAQATQSATYVPPLTLRQEFLEWRAAHRRGEGAFALALIATRRLVLSPRWAPLLRWIARNRRRVLPGRVDFYLSFHIQRSYLLKLTSDWRGRLREIPWLPVAITLFIVNRQGGTTDLEAGWNQHSPNVTVVPVAGNHLTIFDPPHLADLCASFRAALTTETMQMQAQKLAREWEPIKPK